MRHNHSGDLRPDREGSSGRIEGVITLLMALSRAITPGVQPIELTAS